MMSANYSHLGRFQWDFGLFLWSSVILKTLNRAFIQEINRAFTNSTPAS